MYHTVYKLSSKKIIFACRFRHTSYNKYERIYLWGVIMIKALFKHIYKYYKDTFILAIAGVVIGVLVGIIDAAIRAGA